MTVEMALIELSTGAVFTTEQVLQVSRFREQVQPAEPNAEGGTDQPTERDVLLIEMKQGPAERVEGEHAAIDAAKLKAAGFTIGEE
jgi:hypothetical protein